MIMMLAILLSSLPPIYIVYGLYLEYFGKESRTIHMFFYNGNVFEHTQHPILQKQKGPYMYISVLGFQPLKSLLHNT